jgi:hypothetical protein
MHARTHTICKQAREEIDAVGGQILELVREVVISVQSSTDHAKRKVSDWHKSQHRTHVARVSAAYTHANNAAVAETGNATLTAAAGT